MVSIRAWLARTTALRRFALRLGARVVVGVLGGLAAATVTLWLDRRLRITLPLPASNAQQLLGTLVGAVLTIAVFALWMRTVVVSLTSTQASSRVLTGYLDDAFQRTLTGWMMATFTYLTTMAAALPARPEDGVGVPAISSISSLLLVLAAFSAVLLAIHQATISLSMPEVVRTLADRAVSVMEKQLLPDDPPPPTTAHPARTDVHAPTMGWIQTIHHAGIMDRLPPGACLALEVNVSDFVAESDQLAWADADLAEEDTAAIADSFIIVPTRAPEYDLAYAIQQLVDVAEHAMTPSSLDTSTAYESLMHLRAVFHRLIQRGTATGNLRGADGRWIVADSAWQPADHLAVAFRRLVAAGSQDPTTAQQLRSILEALQRTAHEMRDDASQRILIQQQQRLERRAGDCT